MEGAAPTAPYYALRQTLKLLALPPAPRNALCALTIKCHRSKAVAFYGANTNDQSASYDLDSFQFRLVLLLADGFRGSAQFFDRSDHSGTLGTVDDTLFVEDVRPGGQRGFFKCKFLCIHVLTPSNISMKQNNVKYSVYFHK